MDSEFLTRPADGTRVAPVRQRATESALLQSVRWF